MSCPSALSGAVGEVKVLLGARKGGGSRLWVLTLDTEIPCRCVLFALADPVVSLNDLHLKVYESFLCVSSINRNSRYKNQGRKAYKPTTTLSQFISCVTSHKSVTWVCLYFW